MTFSSVPANVSALTHEQIGMVNILPSCYPYVSVLCHCCAYAQLSRCCQRSCRPHFFSEISVSIFPSYIRPTKPLSESLKVLLFPIIYKFKQIVGRDSVHPKIIIIHLDIRHLDCFGGRSWVLEILAVETFCRLVLVHRRKLLSVRSFILRALVIISEKWQCCWGKAALSPANIFKTELLYNLEYYVLGFKDRSRSWVMCWDGRDLFAGELCFDARTGGQVNMIHLLCK